MEFINLEKLGTSSFQNHSTLPPADRTVRPTFLESLAFFLYLLLDRTSCPLQHTGADTTKIVIFIVHSSAGLLLSFFLREGRTCCCDAVMQSEAKLARYTILPRLRPIGPPVGLAAVPELPRPRHKEQSDLLSVIGDDDASFQAIIFDGIRSSRSQEGARSDQK